MSVQDKVERVLREFYVLYSRSEPYDKNVEQVIVNKKEALALLEQLKSCMNEMMEEYEMTSNSMRADGGGEAVTAASVKREDAGMISSGMQITRQKIFMRHQFSILMKHSGISRRSYRTQRMKWKRCSILQRKK